MKNAEVRTMIWLIRYFIVLAMILVWFHGSGGDDP